MAPVIEVGYPQLILDQVAALRAYARGHGHSWKARLWMEWMDATSEPLLHQLRDTHGPAWLDQLVLTSLSTISDKEKHVRQC